MDCGKTAWVLMNRKQRLSEKVKERDEVRVGRFGNDEKGLDAALRMNVVGNSESKPAPLKAKGTAPGAEKGNPEPRREENPGAQSGVTVKTPPYGF